jgi:AraC family transcriptional regulator
MSTHLHIKNMVCNRCIKVVHETLEAIGLHPVDIKLGEAILSEEEQNIDYIKIREVLHENGFELLDDKKALLIEKIKTIVIEIIHQAETVDIHVNFSHLLQEATGKDYHYISSLFSSTEGITIEKYIILQRIERAKELLIYDELTLSEIAYKLGYSSVQHLSAQFKKTTGLTPSAFKQQNDKNRKPLDGLII